MGNTVALTGNVEFNSATNVLNFPAGLTIADARTEATTVTRTKTLLSLLNDRSSKEFYRNASNQLVFIAYTVDWDSSLRYYRRFNRTGNVLNSIETFVGGTFDSTALTLTGGTLIPQGTKTFTRTGDTLTRIDLT